MSPLQKYLLRLVLFGAGKTILHNGAICEVLEVRKQIRRLLPVANEDFTGLNEGLCESKSFWVPRRSSDRKQFKEERIRNARAHRTLRNSRDGNWRGEARPVGAIPVPLNTFTPNPISSGALASTWGKYIPPHHMGNWRGFHFVSVAKGNPQRTQGFFSRNSVERALGKMRTDAVKKAALMEIVYHGQSPAEVARIYGQPLPSLEVAASRLRGQIRREGVFAT